MPSINRHSLHTLSGPLLRVPPHKSKSHRQASRLLRRPPAALPASPASVFSLWGPSGLCHFSTKKEHGQGPSSYTHFLNTVGDLMLSVRH